MTGFTGDDHEYIIRGILKTKYRETLRKKNKPLSYSRVRDIILKILRSVGLNERDYGTHSLRAGGASCAANGGILDRLFKQHGRWVSDKAKDSYIQDNLERLTLSG